MRRAALTSIAIAALGALFLLTGCSASLLPDKSRFHVPEAEYRALDKVLLIGPMFGYIPLREEMREGRVSYRTRYLFDRETYNAIILLSMEEDREVDLFLPNLVTLNYYTDAAEAAKVYELPIIDPATGELGQERLSRLGAAIKKSSDRLEVDAMMFLELVLTALEPSGAPVASGEAALEALRKTPSKLKPGVMLYSQLFDREGRLIWQSEGLYAQLGDISTEPLLQRELHAILTGKSIIEHAEFFKAQFRGLVMASRPSTQSAPKPLEKPMP